MARRTMADVKSKWKAQVLKKPSVKKRSVTRVKGGISPRKELKYVDVATGTLTPTSSGGIVTLLNGIATGDDNTTRDGRQATMHSIHVRGHVFNTGSTAGQVGLARLLLVWDNASNAATPAIADIMTTDSSISFPLINNANRFTVLRDQQWECGPVSNNATAATASGPGCYAIDIYVKLSEITQYVGTGATAASIQNGAIWLVLLQQTAAAGLASFNLVSRVRFSDD